MAEVTIPTRRTIEGRLEGKQRRESLPRKHLATLGDRHPGFDPVRALEAQAVPRVADLVPLRYDRMAASPFAFLRGAAAVMAYDLAMAPTTGIDAQLCGDAHLANFGVFASPERRLIFDVNDFDETLPGPFEWDVKRLAASAAVAMADLGFDEGTIAKVLRRCVGAYRVSMGDLAAQGTLDVWYQRLDIESSIDQLRAMFKDDKGHPVDNIVARARRKDSAQAFSKMVGMIDGRLRFIPDPPVVVPLEDLAEVGTDGRTRTEVLDTAMDEYARSLSADRRHLLDTYERVDIARKVVGVGSVGTRCFVILLLGRDFQDPLILQVKEALPSVLESHLGPTHAATAGQRVIEGQRMMQAVTDIFLGEFRASYSATETHDFYVRQFHDAKASVDFTTVTSPANAAAYLQICAYTLARAHARSGNRAAIAAYLGGSDAFDKAITSWAMAYKERNDADYAAFMAARASGRLPTMATPSPS
jgi:uncharacterized protein (DUF2252 family)